MIHRLSSIADFGKRILSAAASAAASDMECGGSTPPSTGRLHGPPPGMRRIEPRRPKAASSLRTPYRPYRCAAALVVYLCFVAASLTAAMPKPDVIVAADGSGQFTSVQEAISAAPMNTDPAAPGWVILVKPGTYTERIYVQRERGHLHVIGEDASSTVITFNLNANLPGPDGKPIGTFRTPTLEVDGDGMIWENLTIANSAGPVGQALALRADGDRLTFRHCRFLGWQDTLLLNRGRHLFEDCYIEGHVDFIFGGATAYFSRCHIHALRDGYITAASTPKNQPHGFVFADCRITGEDGAKTFLGRPWREFARTVFLRTEMSAAVRPEGWDNWKKPGAEQTTFYAEFGSTGEGASPTSRVSWAKPLTATAAAALTPEAVLGADFANPASVPATSSRAGSHRPRIVLVGDSTVADKSGRGTGFERLVTPDAGNLDTTHLSEEGSVIFAKLVAEDLARVVPTLAPDLRREAILAKSVTP